MVPLKRKFGDFGEKIANGYLLSIGFEILDKNYSKPWGEIDIIAKKSAQIHFIEVKTSIYYPETDFIPEVRVNKRKINALKRICETYISEQNLHKMQEWQIDVISVTLNNDNSVREINLIENAVFEEKY